MLSILLLIFLLTPLNNAPNVLFIFLPAPPSLSSSRSFYSSSSSSSCTSCSYSVFHPFLRCGPCSCAASRVSSAAHIKKTAARSIIIHNQPHQNHYHCHFLSASLPSLRSSAMQSKNFWPVKICICISFPLTCKPQKLCIITFKMPIWSNICRI